MGVVTGSLVPRTATWGARDVAATARRGHRCRTIALWASRADACEFTLPYGHHLLAGVALCAAPGVAGLQWICLTRFWCLFETPLVV